MNTINVSINFKERKCNVEGVTLTEGDYNSTKMVFDYDVEEGIKVLEMKNRLDEIVYFDEIIDNEVVLVGKAQVIKIENDIKYYKYTDANESVYWYDKENNKLYNDEMVEVIDFNLDDYEPVLVDASLFTIDGEYTFEVSLYENNSKLTSAYGTIDVAPEQVVFDETQVELIAPILDNLINKCNEIQEDIETIKDDIIDLDNNKQDTLISGENIKTINNESLLGSGNLEVITDLSDYYTKEEIDNKGYINKDVDDLTNYTKTSDLSEVALSGSYNDLSNTPDLSIYSLVTETGNKINLEINSSTYVLVAKLYDKNNNLLSTSTGIDLPLETMVVGASYDSTTKEIVLVLKNGETTRFSVADLVDGLVSTEELEDNYYNKTQTDTLLNNKVGFTDYASSSVGGVIKVSTFRGLQMSSGNLQSVVKTYEQYTNSTQTSDNAFIGKGTLENVITGKELTNKTYVDEENATQDTQIEALQEENNYLNSIIDQLPKVSGEGEYITLNNTIEGKMSLELGSTELEQGADPSPSNPQQIHTISGDNTIKVVNKNLQPINNYSGIMNSKNGVEVPISLFNGETYNVSFDFANKTQTAQKIGFIGLKSDNSDYWLVETNIGVNQSSGSANISVVFPTPQTDTTKVNLAIGTGNTSSSCDITNFQIEKGTSATSFVKHKEQVKHINLGDLEVCEIGDYKDEFLLTSGKNLFDYSKIEIGKSWYGGSNSKRARWYIELKSGTTYTIKLSDFTNLNEVAILEATSTSSSTSQLWQSVKSSAFELTHTLTSGATYLIIQFQSAYDFTQAMANNIQLMLNEGSTVLPYEPYNNGKWYLKKNIGKVVLDGSETYTQSYATQPNAKHLFKTIINDLKSAITDTEILGIYSNNYNNGFSYNTLLFATEGTMGICVAQNHTLTISDGNYVFSTQLNDFKAWLSTHNTDVYYVLDTPTYTLLNDTLQEQINDIYYTMKSYKEQTNISQVSNDLGFNIKASALLDLNSLINS